MKLLGVDLETTGLDIPTLDVIEFGAVLWDTEREAPLGVMNHLIREDIEIPEEITNITGIEQEDLNLGVSQEEAYADFLDWASAADVLVAHNGLNFDIPIIKRDLAELNMIMPPLPWVDTSVDVDYDTKTRKLVHLAAEHDFVNPFAHRAFADVLTMLKILSYYDIEEVLDNASQNLLEVQAVCKKPWEDTAPDGEKETDKARGRGYRWNAGRKVWIKNIRKSQLETEKEHGEFGVIVLGEIKRGQD